MFTIKLGCSYSGGSQYLNQPLPGSIGRGLGSIGGVSLVEDVADVAAHGPGADKQLLGNFPVRLSSAKKLQHLRLSLGQSVRVGLSRTASGISLVS